MDADGQPLPPSALYLDGKVVPEGFLVLPHDGVGVTAADVLQIINAGIQQANLTRAAIRLPLDKTDNAPVSRKPCCRTSLLCQ